jgi:hypothetical protein
VPLYSFLGENQVKKSEIAKEIFSNAVVFRSLGKNLQSERGYAMIETR